MDPQALPLVIVGLVGAAVFGAIVLKPRKDRKRRDALAVWASDRGYDFAPERNIHDCAVDLGLRELGRNHEFLNVVSGSSEGLPFLLFDHRYEVGSGKNRHTVRRTAAAFKLGGNLSSFRLRPEGMGDKLLSLLGMQDIDFPENPDFSSAYLLRGVNEKKTRRDFNRNVLAFFSGHHGWSVAGAGPWVGFFKASSFLPGTDTRVPPERLAEYLEEARFGASFFNITQ